MKLLLDTHTVLWSLMAPDRLGADARRLLQLRSQPAWFSLVSVWEIAVKISLGKLQLAHSIDSLVTELRSSAIQPLGLAWDHCQIVAELPFHHRDPFDRMLVAQALSGDMTLLSKDEALDAYGIPRIW